MSKARKHRKYFKCYNTNIYKYIFIKCIYKYICKFTF